MTGCHVCPRSKAALRAAAFCILLGLEDKVLHKAHSTLIKNKQKKKESVEGYIRD